MTTLVVLFATDMKTRLLLETDYAPPSTLLKCRVHAYSIRFLGWKFSKKIFQAQIIITHRKF